MNFGRQRVCWTHNQCIDSSNSNHSRTIFSLNASYLLVDLCGISLLVQTLKKEKNMHSKEKIEIYYSLLMEIQHLIDC